MCVVTTSCEPTPLDAAGVPSTCTMNAKMGLERAAVIDAAVERVDVHPITRLARRPRREEEVARQADRVERVAQRPELVARRRRVALEGLGRRLGFS